MISLDAHSQMRLHSASVNKGTMLNREQVIALLKRQQGEKSGREFAAELGITPPYLSDIYAGNRNPGPAVLERLGLTQETIYKRKTA
jgi:hypothetical protein